jgi:hypothetical protein
MFNLLGVTLLQPEHVISARLPEAAGAIGALLTAIQDLLRGRYDDTTASGARTLCIAVAPGRRLQHWLAASEDPPSEDEQAFMRELAPRLNVPEVQDGPIALALVFSFGTEPPAEAELTFPDEWRAIIQASDIAPNVEQIITRLADSQPD